MVEDFSMGKILRTRFEPVDALQGSESMINTFSDQVESLSYVL